MSPSQKILASTLSLETKISRLWAVAMYYYRQPLGDEAWASMRTIAGDGQTSAIAFLTGFARGGATREQLKELAPEIE